MYYNDDDIMLKNIERLSFLLNLEITVPPENYNRHLLSLLGKQINVNRVVNIFKYNPAYVIKLIMLGKFNAA